METLCIFDHPIRCKRVKYIDQSDNSSYHVLSFDIERFSWLIGWKSETRITNGNHVFLSNRDEMRKVYRGPSIDCSLNNIKLEAQWAEPVSLTCHFVLRTLYTEPSVGTFYQI